MKAVVILSGGLDSTVLLWHLRSLKCDCDAVSFNYGQRHARELEAAAEVARVAGVRHDVVDLTSVGRVLGDSALLGGRDVPHGHYADESMRVTVVPNRNMIFLAVAAGIAIARKADAVAYGAHAGDHAIYPDCREEFSAEMQRAIWLADYHRVALLTPFVQASKAEVARVGARLGAPLALTWSCYEGGAKHCGQCGTCVERKEAFERAGVADPTEYFG